MSVVYGAGVLIAADANDRRAWADHKARLQAGVAPLTTAPVVAQVSRSPRQAQLRRFLRGCEVLAFSPAQAHRVGTLLRTTGTSDVVGAHVALVGSDAQAAIWTSDPDHLGQLARDADHPVALRKL